MKLQETTPNQSKIVSPSLRFYTLPKLLPDADKFTMFQPFLRFWISRRRPPRRLRSGSFNPS